ncbi:MAG: butyrate kinase [Clostridiales bacterium]|jgi:butyrate kinase|nr:butyrate kinase [Clostridiales bacterium]
MSHLVLAINPGSTSTKIGLFRDDEVVFIKNIEHDRQEILKFPDTPSQREFRLKFVLEALEEHGVAPTDLSGVVGRGGLMPTIETGGYVINDLMKEWITAERGGSHASNLGSLLADLVAKEAGCGAYIYDSVASGRLPEIAAITGFPEIKRKSLSHVLNSRAQSIEFGKKIGKSFEEMNIIIAHLGGGISLSVYEKGVLMDSVGDDWGPFSPERAGAAPLMDFVNVFHESGINKRDLKKKLRGAGGVVAHLGTTDIREVEQMIHNGDKKARAVLGAMCYNVAKAIGSLATATFGRIDYIIITGGIAKSAMVTELIAERVSFIAPVEIMPGEYELEALAAGCLRIITGQEAPKVLVAIDDEGIGISEIVANGH